jgi:DNA-binding response OmpR family regulator
MRILTIEDEPRMLDLLRKGLYEHGYTVMTAIYGETGLEIATSFEFNATLLEIGLPRLNGYELIQALRKVSTIMRQVASEFSVDLALSRWLGWVD